MQYKQIIKGVFTIDNFFTEEECKYWIEQSEAIGYEEATITTSRGQVMKKSVRNNERVIFDNHELAEKLWEKLKDFMPQEVGIGVAWGLNERFRFYKYFPGQEFKTHRDGSYIRNIHEWSSYTFLIYLNDDIEGGETKFPSFYIKPTAGKALVFYHDIAHSGEKVKEGVKYVLRTDVMYRRKTVV